MLTDGPGAQPSWGVAKFPKTDRSRRRQPRQRLRSRRRRVCINAAAPVNGGEGALPKRVACCCMLSLFLDEERSMPPRMSPHA